MCVLIKVKKWHGSNDASPKVPEDALETRSSLETLHSYLAWMPFLFNWKTHSRKENPWAGFVGTWTVETERMLLTCHKHTDDKSTWTQGPGGAKQIGSGYMHSPCFIQSRLSGGQSLLGLRMRNQGWKIRTLLLQATKSCRTFNRKGTFLFCESFGQLPKTSANGRHVMVWKSL